MTTALSVNLNKIALIRNAREGNYPDVIAFGKLCLDAGADGLTVHPRPDQRHIRPADVTRLAELTRRHPAAEFNMEGNPFADARGSYPGFIALAEHARPDQCTLVPDSDDQLTSDHGFDLTTSAERLAPILEKLHALGSRVSLFMDPEPEQIRLAAELGAERIELYTGPYAEAYGRDNALAERLLKRYRKATETALECGLAVNAGHDLNLQNLPRFLSIDGISEVSIGHALTVDALTIGMAQAVRAYADICRG